MKAAFVRIARSKTSSPAALAALGEIEAAAQAFEVADATLIERIDANKAGRGESPPALARGKRNQIEALANDQSQMDEALIEQLAQLESARSVIATLQFALAQDIPRARSMLKHYPPPDRPLGEEIIALKEGLEAAMRRYLSEHPE